jgi:hypothetical protein
MDLFIPEIFTNLALDAGLSTLRENNVKFA